MSCNCNDNNSVPSPIVTPTPCNPCLDPCTSCGECQDCTCVDPEYLTDGCYFTQGTNCITMSAAIACLEIEEGDLLTSALNKMYLYTKGTLDRLTSDSLVITPTDDACDDKAVIELVPSTDAGNILVLGTDGKPFVPSPDTDSILEFENGLSGPVSNIVRWGGELTQNTLIEGTTDNFTITYERTNAQSVWTSIGLTNRADNATYISYEELLQQSQKRHVSLLADFDSGDPYLHKGFHLITSTDAVHAYNYPSDLSSWDPLKTSFFRTTDHRAAAYGNFITATAADAVITTGALVSGETYRILESSNGTDFTASGATTNAQYTSFVSNGVTPSWEAGDSIRKVPSILHSTVLVKENQIDNAWSVIADTETSIAAPDDFHMVHFVRANLYVTELSSKTDYDTLGGYYAKGQIVIGGDEYVRIGHSVPATSALDGTGAPSNDANATTYSEYKEGIYNIYSKSIRTNTSGLLIREQADTSTTQSAVSILQLVSTTKGFIPPKMNSTQRLAISAIAGLVVYDTTTNKLYCYDGSTWQAAW